MIDRDEIQHFSIVIAILHFLPEQHTWLGAGEYGEAHYWQNVAGKLELTHDVA